MRNFKFLALGIPVALMGVMGSTASATPINLDSTITNASFESGSIGGCPTSWTCGGGSASGEYAPTSVDYVAATDGIGRIVPDGSRVVDMPYNPPEGSALLTSAGLGVIVAGNTYTVDIYIGTPLVTPINQTTPAGQVGTIKIHFLAGGVDATGTGAVTSVSAPAPGKWTLVSFTYTPGANDLGKTLALEFQVDSTPVGGGSGNNNVVDFDIAGTTPPSVPEPASIALFGSAILLAGVGLRKKLSSQQ